MRQPSALASLGVLAAAALLTSAASAQDLYAITAFELIRLDTSNPSAVEPVGDLQLPPAIQVGSLAYHPTQQRFYAVGLTLITSTNRDYFLLEIDPATGAATVRGVLMNSNALGHVESLEYVPPLGALVISHSDGGPSDFQSNQYATVDPTSAARTPIVTSSLDTDFATYDPGRGAYLSLDPNGSGWASVDLSTGASVPSGPAHSTLGDVAFDAANDRIIGLDFAVLGVLWRMSVAGANPSVGPESILGNVPGPELRGLAFGPGPNEIGVGECGPAALNSTGDAAVIRAYGSAVAADNEVRLVGAPLPSSQFALLAVSRDAGSAQPPGSQGTLCLGGAIGRYNGFITGSGAYGAVSVSVDLTRVPQPSTLVAAQAGETWRFQYWYRDVNPAQTSNFTDAVAVTLQ